MKRLKYLMLLLVFGFLLVGCEKEKKIVEPTSGSTPLLLEVTKEGTNNKLYLFGSIHASDESMYPLPEYVMSAYKNSQEIAVEFDLIEYTKNLSSQIESLTKFVIPDGKTVKDYIESETYDQGVEILKNAGLYSPMFNSYMPMFWVTLIENAAVVDVGLDESHGIDQYFLKLAKEDEKEIRELESSEYQYNLLSSFSYDMQVYLLKQSINEYKKKKKELEKLHELYKKGDSKELEQLLLGEEVDSYEEEYNEQLITVRNKTMADSLEESFQEGKDIFCTVGLGHIIGDDGIADLLEQHGYIVKVVK